MKAKTLEPESVEPEYIEMPRQSERTVAIPQRAERMAISSRGDLFARFMGFLTFLIGVAIILGVLWLAFKMYQDPNLGVQNEGAKPTTTDIGKVFIHLVFRITLLFLGSISGSLIANKGINMYFAGVPSKGAER